MTEVKSSPNLDDVFDESKVTESKPADDGRKSGGKGKGRRRKKVAMNLKCPLCESGVKSVSYKDVYQLKKFTSIRGKIVHPEKSGACRKHQRQILKAVKRARYIALLPYVYVEG